MGPDPLPSEQADEIAELWVLLRDAAAAGDDQAAAYLRGYAPWAEAQLALVTRH